MLNWRHLTTSKAGNKSGPNNGNGNGRETPAGLDNATRSLTLKRGISRRRATSFSAAQAIPVGDAPDSVKIPRIRKGSAPSALAKTLNFSAGSRPTARQGDAAVNAAAEDPSTSHNILERSRSPHSCAMRCSKKDIVKVAQDGHVIIDDGHIRSFMSEESLLGGTWPIDTQQMRPVRKQKKVHFRRRFRDRCPSASKRNLRSLVLPQLGLQAQRLDLPKRKVSHRFSLRRNQSLSRDETDLQAIWQTLHVEHLDAHLPLPRPERDQALPAPPADPEVEEARPKESLLSSYSHPPDIELLCAKLDIVVAERELAQARRRDRIRRKPLAQMPLQEVFDQVHVQQQDEITTREGETSIMKKVSAGLRPLPLPEVPLVDAQPSRNTIVAPALEAQTEAVPEILLRPVQTEPVPEILLRPVQLLPLVHTTISSRDFARVSPGQELNQARLDPPQGSRQRSPLLVYQDLPRATQQQSATVKTLVDKEQQTSILAEKVVNKTDVGTDVPSVVQYQPAGQQQETLRDENSSALARRESLRGRERSKRRWQSIRAMNTFDESGRRLGRRIHSDPPSLNRVLATVTSAAMSPLAAADARRPVACYDAYGLPTTSVSAGTSPRPMLLSNLVGEAPILGDFQQQQQQQQQQHPTEHAHGPQAPFQDTLGQSAPIENSLGFQCFSTTTFESCQAYPSDAEIVLYKTEGDVSSEVSYECSNCSAAQKSSAVSREESLCDRTTLSTMAGNLDKAEQVDKDKMSLSTFLSLCDESNVDWGSLGRPSMLSNPCRRGQQQQEQQPQQLSCCSSRSSSLVEDSESDTSFASILLWREVVAQESPYGREAILEGISPHGADSGYSSWSHQPAGPNSGFTSWTQPPMPGRLERLVSSHFSDYSSVREDVDDRVGRRQRGGVTRDLSKDRRHSVSKTDGRDGTLRAIRPGDDTLKAVRPGDDSSKAIRAEDDTLKAIRPVDKTLKTILPRPSGASSVSLGTRIGKRSMSTAEAQSIFHRYLQEESDVDTSTNSSGMGMDTILAEQLATAGEALIAVKSEFNRRKEMRYVQQQRRVERV
ncbi:unnamed protein product [Sympodiomycopsis kandeliae]